MLERVPPAIAEDYDVEILVIDDASADRTFERGHEVAADGAYPFRVTVLFNPVNQGYGGNQKIGYFYAIKHGFDYVALVHGDGQYAPECLPDLLRPLRDGEADASFGSRIMVPGAARKGGMPLYKYVGNRILSSFENWMLKTSLSEFHSGYRVYSVAALKSIPFAHNTNDFHFDTEIIIQFVLAGLRIVERPIPTYYGDEICHVNGVKYAFDVVMAVLKVARPASGPALRPALRHRQARRRGERPVSAEDRLRFPAFLRARSRAGASPRPRSRLRRRLHGRAPHEGEGAVASLASTFIRFPSGVTLDGFRQHDLNRGLPDVPFKDFDNVLMLDVIEHLTEPESFMAALRRALGTNPDARVIVSTGNVGFFVTRLMLLIGQFNYGKRGILDMTHTRLFTFASLRRLFEQNGFRIVEMKGVPGPFPLAMGEPARAASWCG